MNFVNIIEGIERLVVSLMFWIIFIPKSIYKIVTDPKWVPGYVTKELEKDKDRFKDFMSPIILYLLNSVFLIFVYIFIKRDILKDINTISIDDKKSIWEKIVDGLDITGDLITNLSGSYGIVIAAVCLCFPLFFSLIIEVLKDSAFTRDGLRRATYIQCYYFTPLSLTFSFIVFSSSLLGIIEQNLFLIVFLVFAFWFTTTEIKFISKELQKKIFASLLIYGVLLIGIGISSYVVITVFGVFDEDHRTIRGGTFELPINNKKDSLKYTVIIKCVPCNTITDESLIVDRTLITNDHIELYEDDLPAKKVNEIPFYIKKNEKAKLKLEISEDLGHELYIDIWDEENYSIIGGIRSKEAMLIRKGISYFIVILFAIIVSFGIKSLFKKVHITRN